MAVLVQRGKGKLENQVALFRKLPVLNIRLPGPAGVRCPGFIIFQPCLCTEGAAVFQIVADQIDMPAFGDADGFQAGVLPAERCLAESGKGVRRPA